MAKDLVCKMHVDERTAPAKYEYQGKVYYFCHPGCKMAFQKDPEKYLKGQGMGIHH
ncbi:MAG: YHS domain-containing protein [Anaerolineae bacterium]|nr:YHS domain-containing protein [Anaerolineae bacterium]